MTALLDTLARLNACHEARAWVASQHGSAYAIWRRCDRGDWLLWLAARAAVIPRLMRQPERLRGRAMPTVDWRP